MERKPTDFERELVTRTELYLEQIADCVTLLSRLLDAYAEGGEYRDVADDIRTLESECDESNRRIAGLISNSTVQDVGLRNARFHLNSPQLLELYQRLDAISNTAERIADEIVTIEPSQFEASLGRFQGMVEQAATAQEALDAAAVTFIRLLCDPRRSDTIADEIRTVRDAESSCDRLRNELVASTFSDGSVARPMIHREFALHFDRLVDAMEGVTDQIVLVSSSESWIAAEPAADG